MADLATLAEYKTYKQITNPNKDAVLQQLITSVSDLIKTYCGRTFIDYYSTPVTEEFTMTEGMTEVILKECPINLVSTVTLDGTDITADVQIEKPLAIIRYDLGFTPGVGTVDVTYTGGYAATPADLKLAVYELVDYYHNDEHKSRKTFGGSSIEYHQDQNSWPHHIRSILDMYRDV